MCAVYILIQKVVTILHSVLQVCIFNLSLYIEEFHLLMMFIFDPFVESWQFSLLCQNVDYHLKSKMWIIFLRPNVEYDFDCLLLHTQWRVFQQCLLEQGDML
jgi:hypothetical protein